MDAKENINGRVPSTGTALRIAIIVFGLAGTGISAYLTYIHYRWVEPACLPGFDCNSVLFSPYATTWGLPISLLGLVMYSLLTIGALFLFHRRERVASLSALWIYFLALSGALYSLYLTYREAFKFHAFCSWCLGSAIVVACLLILTVINLGRYGVRLRLPGTGTVSDEIDRQDIV